MKMMKAWLRNWNFPRIVRLVLGVLVIAEAIRTQHAMLAVPGVLLAAMALLNVGCCTAGYCPPESRKNTEASDNNTTPAITYEEVHTR